MSATVPLPATEARRLKCPLLVGFTGHRDLRPEEEPALERAVEAVLADVAARFPHSPLVVVSGLADGADRLAARVARRRGLEFVAVLPLPLSLYVADFGTPGARAEFDELLAGAAGRYELPLPDGSDAATVSGPGPDRDACYAGLGTFLAERSHVLVALWDGVDNGKPGGTASVVKARTAPTSRPESLAWRELLPNDVVHILAGRESTGAAVEPGLTTVVLPSRTLAPRARPRLEDDDVTSRIDDFNRDVDRWGGRLAAGFLASAGYLCPGDLPPPRAGTAAAIRDHFAGFDRLAIHWQAKAARWFLRLHVLIWLAVACFEMFTNFQGFVPMSGAGVDRWHVRQGLVGLYLVFIAAAWAAAVWSHRRQQQPKHLDYRSIAEALRIQFFWRLAGLDRRAADEFLASQLSVLGWMRSAVATVTLIADARHPEERAAAPARTLRLVNRWLCLEQLRYFKKAALRDDLRLARRTRLGAALFLAGLAVTVGFAAAGFQPVVLESVAAMLFVTAGLIASHTETLALDEHINQYSGMAYLYAAARRGVLRALRAGDLPRARGIIAEVGAEALEENAAWVLVHRNRPLRVPQAG